jgi:glycosyltransferase involved in cell wall biosynthesis
MADRGRLLVVSHPAVLAVNQLVYAELRALGWDLTLVVPALWRHEYARDAFPAERLEEIRTLPVLFAGRPQRHVYRARVSKVLRAVSPDVLFLEEEPFSLPALQWGRAAVRAKVPFGLQSWENLDRPLPWLARAIERHSLRHAAFVAARTPAAARRLASPKARLAPHGVPRWEPVPANRNGTFTIGYAGRLVPEKGIPDLLAAARRIQGSRLVLVGDGPLRSEAQRAGADVRTGVRHGDMATEYARMDVLVLPSRTTPTWTEQFGRVLVEALSCGVPVVGSDAGEIPWLIGETGGGLVVPEGDAAALADALARLRDEPALRAQLAERGRAAVESRFSVEAAARALDALLVEATA